MFRADTERLTVRTRRLELPLIQGSLVIAILKAMAIQAVTAIKMVRQQSTVATERRMAIRTVEE